MTLTQAGIDYICENFGDENLCCVEIGLSWFYTVGGIPYQETGGTAQIVSRLASGLITDLTMTYPNRGTFTQIELNNANGAPVTIQDAQQIANHDTANEGQYCFAAPPPPLICEDYQTEMECISNNCYWYDGSCHSDPQTPPPPPPPSGEFPWIYVAAGAGAIIVVGALAYSLKKKK